jgi:hypothetical protein
LTKNQIIAKAMLTTLGIYAVFIILNVIFYPSVQIPQESSLLGFFIKIIVCIICLVPIAYYLVFKNDALACRITGNQEGTEEDFNQGHYLIKTLRIGFVILGLLILVNSARDLMILVKYFPLTNIRLWITDVIEDKSIRDNLDLSVEVKRYISALFELLVSVYLICGAPQLIRWHLKRFCLNKKQKRLQNE